MRASSVVALGCGWALLACGGGPLESVEGQASTESAVQGGTDDTANRYTFAVGLSMGGGVCSGALIAPNLVLTARHCVAQSPQAINCSSAQFGGLRVAERGGVTVTTGNRLRAGGRTYRSTRIVTPSAAGLCGNDIALIVLDANVPSSEATTVTPAIDPPVTDSRYSRQVTVIGFGATSPQQQGSGTRRIRESIPIRCIGNEPQFSCTRLLGSQVSERELVITEGVCQGDSGSSAYEQRAFDGWKSGATAPVSLGVLSRGGQRNGACTDAIYTRVDSFKSLIVQTAKEAAQAGGYAVPAWAEGPTEPIGDGGAPPPPPPPDAGTANDAGPARPRDAGGSGGGNPTTGDDPDDGAEPSRPNEGTPLDDAEGSGNGNNPSSSASDGADVGASSGCNTGGRRPPAGELWFGVLAAGLWLTWQRRRETRAGRAMR
jgi:hypothetical protein